MKKSLKKWIPSGLFTAGGMVIGFVYYVAWGCTSGCMISSSPARSMLYMGFIGWLLSHVISDKEKI